MLSLVLYWVDIILYLISFQLKIIILSDGIQIDTTYALSKHIEK